MSRGALYKRVRVVIFLKFYGREICGRHRDFYPGLYNELEGQILQFMPRTNTPFVNTSVNFQQKTTLLSSDIKNLENKEKFFFFIKM